MSTFAVGDRVQYIGPDDGALRRGSLGEVTRKGDSVIEVDFGGIVGSLPIQVTRLRKIT